MPIVAPTAAEIRAESVVVFAEYGWGTGDEAPDPLALLVREALAEFQGTMAIFADEGVVFTEIEEGTVLETLVRKALRMWVEWLAASTQPENVDLAADHDPQNRAPGGRTPNLAMWHPWPQLDRILRYLVRLYNNEIQPDDLPADVPIFRADDPMVPKPGDVVMKRRYRHEPMPFGPGTPGNGAFYGSS